MRVNQVVVVPAFQANTKPGRYIGRHSEHDVIGSYVTSLVDELDEDLVQHSLYIHGQTQLIMPNSLVLHCGIGWQGNGGGQKALKNVSTITHGPQPGSKKFAEILAESISDWGKCFVDHGHRTKAVELEQDLSFLVVPDTIAISIEPFKINGPNCQDYCTKLYELGQVLSQSLFEFLLSRNEQPRIMRSPQKSGDV